MSYVSIGRSDAPVQLSHRLDVGRGHHCCRVRVEDEQGGTVTQTHAQIMAQKTIKIGAVCVLFAVGTITPSLFPPDTSPSRRVAAQFSINPACRTNLVAAKAALAHLPKRFQWASLESTDYRQYISNLRAIGCPRETLKDIIIADLNSLYAKRINMLNRQLIEDELVFWRTSDLQHRGFMRQRMEIDRIEKEKRDILRQLLDLEADETITSIWGVSEQMQADMQCVPVEKRCDVAELNAHYSQLEQEVLYKARGMLDPDAVREIKSLRDRRDGELAKLLTPEQLFEYDLRFAGLGETILRNSPSFDFSEDEFRKVFATRQKLESEFGPHGGAGTVADAGAAHRRSELISEMKDQLRAELGDARYSDYQRSQDAAFQEESQFGQIHSIPEERILMVYEVEREAVAQANQLRAQGRINPEVLNARLNDVRAAAEQAIRQTLGEKAGLQDFPKQQSFWLRNLRPIK